MPDISDKSTTDPNPVGTHTMNGQGSGAAGFKQTPVSGQSAEPGTAPVPFAGKKVQPTKRSVSVKRKSSPYVRKRKPTVRKSENPVGRPRTVPRPAAGTNLVAKMVQSAKKTQSDRKAAQTARLVQTARLFQAAIVSPTSSHRSIASHASSTPDNMTKSNDPFKLSMHINIVSGFSKPVEHSVYREHTYSRPHNWIPEHMYMKPTRYLFSEKPISPSLQRKLDARASDVEVDIELVDSERSMPYCEAWNSAVTWRHDDRAEEAGDGSDNEDETSWEEKISRDGWSAGQARLFNSIANALDAIELRSIVCKGSPSEFVTMGTTYDMHANDLRYQLVNCHYDPRLPVWLHAVLLERLPAGYRQHYAELLARVKKSVPHIIESMIKVAPPHVVTGRVPAATPNIAPNIHLPVVDGDPVADQLIREKFKRLPHSPVFVIVPDDHRMLRKKRFLLFTTMLSQMGHTFTVQLTKAPDGATVNQGLEHKMAEVRSKLSEIRSKLSSRDIVLVGFNTGAALGTLLALIEPVYAVVCLGFPVATVRGNRGLPDDAILNIRCPVLFFIGEHANTASVPLMDAMRGRMGVHTQLVVMGMCDDQLVMPRQRMLDICVTQAMVDKSILVEIHTFLGQLLTNPVSMSIAPPNKPKVTAQTAQKRAKAAAAASNNDATEAAVEAKPVRRYAKKQNAPFPAQCKRKPARMSASQQLMLSSAKYASELPADYAAKLKDTAAAAVATVTPGLWQSKYKNPMLSPSPDRAKQPGVPTSSPQTVHRSLTFGGPGRQSPSSPMSPHSVGATSVFVTPSVPGSSGAITTIASSQTVKVISTTSSVGSRVVRRPATSTATSGMPLIASALPSGCYPITSRSDVTKLMTVLASRPNAPASVRPTKVVMLGENLHKTPLLVPSTTINSSSFPKSSHHVTVSSANSRRASAPYSVQSQQPLTADNILNLPIIFAQDDDNIFQMAKEKTDDSFDASTYPSTSSITYSQPGDAIDITPVRNAESLGKTTTESRIVNKFEFSKPQPGVKYRKIFLTRLNQNDDTNVPQIKPNIKTITIQPNAIVDSVEASSYAPRGMPRQLGLARLVAHPPSAPRLLGPLKHVGPGRPRNPGPGRMQGTVRYTGPGRPSGGLVKPARVTMIQQVGDGDGEGAKRGFKRKMSPLTGKLEGLSLKRQCP